MKKYKVKTLEDAREVAKDVLAGFISGEFNKIKSTSENIHVALLSGDLGAGKTAFVKLLAEELGIEETVVSPTFALLKVYKILPAAGGAYGDKKNKKDSVSKLKFKSLVHVDLYRLEKANKEQIINIGLEEYLEDKDSLVMIEWPERLESEIENAIELNFVLKNDGSREIVMG